MVTESLCVEFLSIGFNIGCCANYFFSLISWELQQETISKKKNSPGEVFLWTPTSSRTTFLLLTFTLPLLSHSLFTWGDIIEGALKTFPWTCYGQEGFSIQDLANECCQQERAQEAKNSSTTRIPKPDAQWICFLHGICFLAWPRKGRCVDTCELLTQTHTHSLSV